MKNKLLCRLIPRILITGVEPPFYRISLNGYFLMATYFWLMLIDEVDAFTKTSARSSDASEGLIFFSFKRKTI